jgi:hypothetical protein
VRLTNRESDVLSSCLRWLTYKGVWCWRQNQGAIPLPGGGFRKFVGMKGVSDILGILPQKVEVVGEPGPITFGNLLAVETKRRGEKLRPDQAEFLATVNKLGGVGVCVHSVDELEAALAPFLDPPRSTPPASARLPRSGSGTRPAAAA